MDGKFIEQLEHCKYSTGVGPDKPMKWGVPDTAKNKLTDETIHDDDIITAALCCVLDQGRWHIPTPLVTADGYDPLEFAKGKF